VRNEIETKRIVSGKKPKQNQAKCNEKKKEKFNMTRRLRGFIIY
jgi:hypothetical protein